MKKRKFHASAPHQSYPATRSTVFGEHNTGSLTTALLYIAYILYDAKVCNDTFHPCQIQNSEQARRMYNHTSTLNDELVTNESNNMFQSMEHHSPIMTHAGQSVRLLDFVFPHPDGILIHYDILIRTRIGRMGFSYGW